MTLSALQLLPQGSLSTLFMTPPTVHHSLTPLVPYPVVLHRMESAEVPTVVPTVPPVLQALPDSSAFSTPAFPPPDVPSVDIHTTNTRRRETRLGRRSFAAISAPAMSLLASELVDLLQQFDFLFPPMLSHEVDGEPMPRSVAIACLHIRRPHRPSAQHVLRSPSSVSSLPAMCYIFFFIVPGS